MSKHITVIGGGFAALTAARCLRQHDSAAKITLLAPQPALTYLPSLIWLPSGKRKPEDLVVPLEKFFREQRIASSPARQPGSARTAGKWRPAPAPVANDGLVIACGGRFIKKLPGIEHAILPCEGIAPVERLREKVAALQSGTIALGFAGNPNEPVAMRGGPVFEFALRPRYPAAPRRAPRQDPAGVLQPHAQARQPPRRKGRAAPDGGDAAARHRDPPGPQDRRLRGRQGEDRRAARFPPTSSSSCPA
jgi:hypothetical protein